MSLRPSQSLCIYQILDNLGNILLATLNPTITCSPERIRGFLLVELDILKNLKNDTLCLPSNFSSPIFRWHYSYDLCGSYVGSSLTMSELRPVQ